MMLKYTMSGNVEFLLGAKDKSRLPRMEEDNNGLLANYSTRLPGRSNA